MNTAYNSSENWINSDIGLVRLYGLLGNYENFPVPVKAVESFTAISENELCRIFKQSTDYFIQGGKIYRC